MERETEHIEELDDDESIMDRIEDVAENIKEEVVESTEKVSDLIKNNQKARLIAAGFAAVTIILLALWILRVT